MTKMRKVLALLLTLATLLNGLPALAAEETAQPEEAAQTETAEAPQEQAPAVDTETSEDAAPAADTEVPEDAAPAADAEVPEDAAPAVDAEVPEDAAPAADTETPEDPVEEVAPVQQEPADEQVPDAEDPAPEEEAVLTPDGEQPAAQESAEEQSAVPESREVFSVETETGTVKRLLEGTGTKDAIVLTPGKRVENLFPIGGGTVKDYYKLTLKTPGVLGISGESAVKPIDLLLLDYKGNTIETMAGIDLSKHTTRELTAGTYYLVFSKTGAGAGVYSFTPTFNAVSVTEPETFEKPNNTKAKASTASLNTAVVGHFSVTDDEDWYKLTLPKSGKVRFDAVCLLSGVDYELQASDGFVVFSKHGASDHGTGENRVSSVQADVIGGTYYLRVTSADVGKYTFQVKFTAANETFADAVGACANSFWTAHVLKANTVYNGQIAENSSVDVFKFTVGGEKDIVELVAATKLPKVRYQIYDKDRTLLKTIESSWTSASVAGKVDEKLPLGKGVYYLVVRGTDGFTGAYSFQLKAKNQFAPIIRTASNVVGGILLEWDDFEAVKYRVYYKTTGSWQIAGYSTGTSYVFRNVKPNTKYTFTIRSMDKNGKFASAGYDTKGISIRYYAAPTMKSATLLTGGIKVDWTASAGVSKYAFFVRPPKGTWSKVGTVAGTSYTYTKVKNNTTYEFMVRGVTADGKTYLTGEKDKGIQRTFLSAPKITSATVENDGIHLSWSRQEGVAKFRLFYKVGSGKWNKVEDTNKTSTVVKKLPTGKTYDFTLRCVDAKGKEYTSAFYSPGKRVLYLATPKLLAPASITANSAKISWNASAGAPKYRVFLRVKGGNWKNVADVTATSYVLTKLKAKTSYEFMVRALSADGKTLLSGYEIRTFKTK